MSSLAILSVPSFSPAISSRTGAIILHGPHQVAQKSTSTGVSDLRTSESKVRSVVVNGFLAKASSRGVSSTPGVLSSRSRRSRARTRGDAIVVAESERAAIRLATNLGFILPRLNVATSQNLAGEGMT